MEKGKPLAKTKSLGGSSMKRIAKFTGVAVLIVGSVLLIGACQGHGPFSHNQKGVKEMAEFAVFRVASELDLTEAQKTLLTKSIDEVHRKMKETHASQNGHFQDLKGLILSPDLTADQVNRLIQEGADRLAPVKELVVQKLVEFQKTLTAQQKEKLTALLEKHQAEFKDN
jgi:uncharacterized membrane protein